MERFNIHTTVKPSQAVICIQQGTLQIVPFCKEAHDFYFNDEQKNYLKSLAAYPIKNYGPDQRSPIKCCLVIDSDQEGFFEEEDRKELDLILEHFGHRLCLEGMRRELIGRSVSRREVDGVVPEPVK
jgi:hypothetical protein